jgi:hypothetical protein
MHAVKIGVFDPLRVRCNLTIVNGAAESAVSKMLRTASGSDSASDSTSVKLPVRYDVNNNYAHTCLCLARNVCSKSDADDGTKDEEDEMDKQAKHDKVHEEASEGQAGMEGKQGSGDGEVGHKKVTVGSKKGENWKEKEQTLASATARAKYAYKCVSTCICVRVCVLVHACV